MKHTKEELAKKLSETGIDFTEKDIDLILDGRPTTLKENISLEDGRKKDAKILVSEDNTGKLKFKYYFKEHELIIPKKIGNKVFSDEETLALKQGKPVNVNYKGENLFLQVDPELKSIVVKKAEEINLKDITTFKLGQYEFNQKEIEQLKNKERVPSVVLKGEHGYFMASVRLTEDNKGIEYSDYKELSEKQAKELLEKQNSSKQISNTLEASSKIEYSSSQSNAIENTTSVTAEQNNSLYKSNTLKEHEEKMLIAIKEKDFTKANALAKNIPSPSDKLLNNIQNDKNISTEDKVAAYTILNLDKNKINERISEVKNHDTTNEIKAEKDLDKNQITDKKKGNKLEQAAKTTEKISNIAFGDT